MTNRRLEATRRSPEKFATQDYEAMGGQRQAAFHDRGAFRPTINSTMGRALNALQRASAVHLLLKYEYAA